MQQTIGTTRYQGITIGHLSQIIEAIKKNPVPIAIDLETTGLDFQSDKVITIQFGTVRRAFILDCRSYYVAAEDDKEYWRLQLQALKEAAPIFVGHNIKFDWKFLAYHFGMCLDHIVDTMIQELVIHGVGIGKAENNGISVNMFDTAARYDLQVSKEERSWFIGLDTREQWDLPLPEEQLRYCAQDVAIPLLISDLQQTELQAKELVQVAQLENTCLPAIARMELDGCYIDRAKWSAIIKQKKEARDILEKSLQEALTPYIAGPRQAEYEKGLHDLQTWEAERDQTLAQVRKEYEEDLQAGIEGYGLPWGKYKIEGMKAWKADHPRPKTPKLDLSPINLRSHNQLTVALGGLGIQVESTDKEHLAPFKRDFPVIKDLLDWKELDKFINAFGDNLLAKIGSDQRIHPNYNQIGADTGRMSCSNPNWQQIPSHEKEETSVRKCVIGTPGNKILTADFSNIEARILADMSQDENLLAFFEQGGDLHCTTARLMFGLTATDKELKGNKEDGIHPLELKPGLAYRSIAKTINFGLIYGMSPVKLGRTLGISTEEAEKLFNKYFAAYPGVANWLHIASQTALEKGHSITLAGRKRFYEVLPDIPYDATRMSWDEYMAIRAWRYKVNGAYERKAKNAPIQGTSADITKYALALLYKYLPTYVRLIACVHDEIVLECPEDKAPVVSKLLSTIMYKACKHFLHTVYIPPVDVSVEDYWKKD